jgi:hypothetical protein
MEISGQLHVPNALPLPGARVPSTHWIRSCGIGTLVVQPITFSKILLQESNVADVIYDEPCMCLLATAT